MAVDNRMIVLTSNDANTTAEDATALISSSDADNILIGELAINSNTGNLYAGCEVGEAGASIGASAGKSTDTGDILGITLSTAATMQAVGTGASPTFDDLTLSGGDIAFGNAQASTLTIADTATNAAGKAMTISAGKAATGTDNDVAGGALTFQAGQGKGTGAGGSIFFKTANAVGSTAATHNSLVTALTLEDDLKATFAGEVAIAGATSVAGMITANGGLTLGAGDDLLGSATSDITINSDKFTVAGATGNTVVAGTLTVTGNADFDGTLEFDSISGTGSVAITDILDTDAMSDASATTLATSESIKAYVDSVGHASAQGLSVKTDCRVATTIELNATYVNVDDSPDAQGATLTNAGTDAALVIDGITVSTSDRVLVKGQASATAYENGIYTVTNLGSVSSNWVLTRATDMDSGGTGTSTRTTWANAFVFITAGATNGATSWVSTVDELDFIAGTTLINFAQFSSAGAFTASGGLEKSGNDVFISTAGVTNAKMADMAANTIKVRNANDAGVPSDVALATTQLLIGDGTGFTAAALSGDATMTNAGVVTVSGAGSFDLDGDVDSLTQATDWDLIDNSASALSFDTSGKAGILNIVTTNSGEKVTMSGGCDVTGTLTAGTFAPAALETTGKLTVDLATGDYAMSVDGMYVHAEGGVVMRDNSTSASGTNAVHVSAISFEPPSTLTATNASVTTTTASTVHITAPMVSGTNNTIANAYALYCNGAIGGATMSGGTF
jgi:hypothetical protein